MLLLDCFTKSGRESRSVKEQTLLEAKGCLNKLKINLVSKMPRIAQVRYQEYHLTRSDQCFREERLVNACGHAQIGFDLSLRYHFNTIDAAKVRLNYVSRLRNSN